jgi:hypothetical protein
MLDGPGEALVAAKHLVGVPGIEIVEQPRRVDYYHLMCAAHEVILAEGAEVETLLPGPQALKLLGDAAYDEVVTLFPEICEAGFAAEPARRILPGRQARRLAMRHEKNAITLC